MTAENYDDTKKLSIRFFHFFILPIKRV